MSFNYLVHDARVTEYIKGLIDERTLDFKLNRPTKFKKITNEVNN